MELIKVTKENIEDEHICCAISNNKDCQVLSKKTWLKDRFEDDLVFLKGNVRGKCFDFVDDQVIENFKIIVLHKNINNMCRTLYLIRT